MATVSAVGSASELSLPTGTSRIAAGSRRARRAAFTLARAVARASHPAGLHRRFPCSAFRRAVRHRVRIGSMPRSCVTCAWRVRCGRRLAAQGFTVMTGGGPGLMEAANRGARDGGGLSVGCNIKLPAGAAAQCLPRSIGDVRSTSSSAKVLLIQVPRFCVRGGCPAASATMDEVFEALTLIADSARSRTSQSS